MQATDQAATAKIAIPKDSSIQEPIVSAFRGKNSFKSVIIIPAFRILSSSDRLSYNIKKLRQTTSQERENLKIAAQDSKKLKI